MSSDEKTLMSRTLMPGADELRYGDERLQEMWYDVRKYMESKKWLEERPLKRLRPSMQTLVGKKDLVGIEVGVGHGLHSECIYENLDIKKLYLIDLNVPWKESIGKASPIIHKPGVEFIQGDSIDILKKLVEDEDVEEFDFAYLDGNHHYEYVLAEIAIIYQKIKEGGILAGHDYDQIGVMGAVQTFMLNVWRIIGEKPDSFFFESCKDDHPGYPEEYIEIGFPIDWWHVKKHNIDKYDIFKLRDG